jgi:tRNA A37 threonylcarbamoyladenosine synthetase subunit TsaC/SUA5/YrdC
MSQLFEVHPENPQPRLLKQAAQILADGGVCAVPTDSSYALVCHLDDKAAADALRRIRGVDDKHHLTLLCRDLSELASYARVDNKQYRLLKHGRRWSMPARARCSRPRWSTSPAMSRW